MRKASAFTGGDLAQCLWATKQPRDKTNCELEEVGQDTETPQKVDKVN